MIKKRLMSIDPSINNLGVAVWDLGKKQLMMWKLVHPLRDAKNNEYDKALSMLSQLRKWKEAYGVTNIICEVPAHWVVAGFAARETGSIAKLCFVCGLLYSMTNEVEEYKLVKPHEWKGQLPKKVVANRLKEAYVSYGIDMEELDENVMDSIGIGHFYLHGSV